MAELKIVVVPNEQKPITVSVTVEKPEQKTATAIVTVGNWPNEKADSIVAREAAHVRSPYERRYLCPECGQDGAIDPHILKPGGTVTCPACGDVMNETKGGA